MHDFARKSDQAVFGKSFSSDMADDTDNAKKVDTHTHIHSDWERERDREIYRCIHVVGVCILYVLLEMTTSPSNDECLQCSTQDKKRFARRNQTFKGISKSTTDVNATESEVCIQFTVTSSMKATAALET